MDRGRYEHYIPQFMLRRFAAPQATNLASMSPSNRKRERDRLKYTASVKVANLDKSPPDITDELVRRTFGQQDMYTRIEKKLSEIERDASRIIARVIDAHEAGKGMILLSRYENDLLRKFQFVMKYRGPIFFRRFNHQTAETYDSDDRDQFLEYMRRKNFQRPLDVWFDNLEKIIDEPMDPAGSWTWRISDSIYPPDAVWLFGNIWFMYTAFVTPAEPDEEFILTENAFGIHEGPTSFTVNRFTGKETQTAYTEFHLLTIISPRLAMVLRHSSLPQPLKDMDPGLRKQGLDTLAEHMLAEQAQMHVDPEHATSILQDLPIAKARKSYTTLENGRLIPAEGADGKPRACDKFEFVFFRLESTHIQTINMVMLDQAHTISKLVFKSGPAFRKALEFYLDYPCLTKGLHSMKTVSDRPDDPRLILLKKLEHLAHILGSDVVAKYHVDPLWEDYRHMSIDEAIAQVLETTTPMMLPDPSPIHMKILTEVLVKTRLQLRMSYAIDRAFPDLVYATIQKVAQKYPGERTENLLNIDRRMWVYGWYEIVEMMMQNPDSEPNDDFLAMHEKLRQSRHEMYAEIQQEMRKATKPTTKPSLRARQLQQELLTGLSKRRLNKAFDDMGRDMERGTERDRERRDSLSPTQSLVNHSYSHPTISVVEENAENDLAHRSEEMETRSKTSLDDIPATMPIVLPGNTQSTATTPLWFFALLSIGLLPLTILFLNLCFVLLILFFRIVIILEFIIKIFELNASCMRPPAGRTGNERSTTTVARLGYFVFSIIVVAFIVYGPAIAKLLF
jgi:hypothetical protein